MSFCAWRNPEGVASPLADRKPIANPSQPLQGWDENKHAPFFQSKPWAGISQRFQRYACHPTKTNMHPFFKANPGLELANAFSVTLATWTTETQSTRGSHREIEFKTLPDPGLPRYDHPSGDAPLGIPVRALPQAILFHAFGVKTRRQVENLLLPEIRMSRCPEVGLCFQSGTRCNTIPAH